MKNVILGINAQLTVQKRIAEVQGNFRRAHALEDTRKLAEALYESYEECERDRIAMSKTLVIAIDQSEGTYLDWVVEQTLLFNLNKVCDARRELRANLAALEESLYI